MGTGRLIGQAKLRLRAGRFAAAMVAGLAAGLPAAAQAKDYVFATFVPPTHGIVVHALNPLIDEIKADTKGSVSFTLKPGAQLFKGPESITSTGRGLADATTYAPHYNPSQLPHVYILVDLQLVAPNGVVGAAAAMDTILNCPECMNDYKKANTLVLALYGTGTNNLWCRKDVKTVADAKGLKIRTSGATGRFVKALSGTAVGMAISEMPGAMERGQIDCVIGPLAWIKSYGMIDSVKSIVDFPIGSYPAANTLVMNLDTWKGFSAADKKAVWRRAALAQARATNDGYLKFDDEALKEIAEKKIPINAGGKDYDELLEKHLVSEIAATVEGAKKRGVADPQKVIDLFLANVKKWSGILGKAPYDTAAYDKALWDNLYSKIDPEKL